MEGDGVRRHVVPLPRHLLLEPVEEFDLGVHPALGERREPCVDAKTAPPAVKDPVEGVPRTESGHAAAIGVLPVEPLQHGHVRVRAHLVGADPAGRRNRRGFPGIPGRRTSAHW